MEAAWLGTVAAVVGRLKGVTCTLADHGGHAMSQTTVLERRHSIRRDAAHPRQVLAEQHRLEGRVYEVRAPDQGDSERRGGVERREYVPSHHITVGRVSGSAGWMGGVCSCGEHTLSRVDGLIECWARWHRSEVIAQKAPFVHSS